ncbi:hypothetical protein Moror_4174 [Moniliophthora roreri MCA 2997]|uniref:Uncharacterized protein n=1 Tax=Moniliophthora roreri (strain MCA 2997) TaxID=1381753 RepID=V2WUZ7_MONRO|nr:hypothetical protein Moror_4174 [Moniliophthora roreri MCA 2997]
MSISDSSLVHLTDSTLNNVGRDQINHIIQHITTQAVNVRNITTAVTSDDEDYSEYTTVKRGDMFIVKKVQSEEVEDRRWDGTKGILSAQGKKTLYTVEVHGKKFTAATYSGWNTHKLWKRDYFSYSSQLDESCIQLFGINTSIPALIFHHEYAQSLGIPELEILYNNQKDTHNASGTVAGHTEEIDQMVGQDLHNGEGGNTKPERTGNSCQTLQKGKGKGKALDLGGSTNCSKYVKKKASTVVEQSATGSAPPSHQPHVIKPSTRVQNRDLGGNSTQKKATSITKKSAMGLASPSYHEPHAAAIKPFPRTRDQESNLESLNKRPRQQQQQTLKLAWR